MFVLFLKELRPGKLPCPIYRDELNLGDIFLGVEYLMKQCQQQSQDLHGILTVSKLLVKQPHNACTTFILFN